MITILYKENPFLCTDTCKEGGIQYSPANKPNSKSNKQRKELIDFLLCIQPVINTNKKITGEFEKTGFANLQRNAI